MRATYGVVLVVALLVVGVTAQRPGGLWERLRAGAGHTYKNTAGGSCPPKGFDSVPDFDILGYISAPWYVQQQMPVLYQPENTLYCVRAEYVPVNSSNLKEGFIVKNYANNNRVNGPSRGTSDGNPFSEIRAVFAEPDSNNSTASSKLLVGPAFLGRLAQVFYGPYWVVAVGKSADPKLKYDWAIVTGGAPTRSAEGGCVVGGSRLLDGINDSGFWLFSRKPVDPEATAIMRTQAQKLGLDLSVLKNVTQEGCLYKN